LNREITRLTREIQSVEVELTFLQQNHDRAQRRHIMRDNRQIAQIAEIQGRLFKLQDETKGCRDVLEEEIMEEEIFK